MPATAIKVDGTADRSFRLEGPGGARLLYGVTHDSRIGAAESGEYWLLNESVDANGSRAEFKYGPNTLPSSISYTADPTSGARLNRLDFFFEGSGKGRVARVEIRQDETLVRKYVFQYDNRAGQATRLSKIMVCAAPIENCKQRAAFEWYDGASGFRKASVRGTGYPDVSPLVYAPDLNADGSADLLWYTGNAWFYSLTERGSLGPVRAGPVTARRWSQLVDWDGDGRVDLMYAAGGTFQVARFGTKGFEAPIGAGAPFEVAYDYLAADLNGDGRDDLIKVASVAPADSPNHGTLWARLRADSGFGAEAVAFHKDMMWFYAGSGAEMKIVSSLVTQADFNSDGRTDLLMPGCVNYEENEGTCTGEDGWFVMYSKVAADARVVTSGDLYVERHLLNSSGGRQVAPVLGEFDGDGRMDVAYTGASNWHWLGSSTRTPAIAQVASTDGFSTGSMCVADYDGDGMSDLFAYSTARERMEVLRSNGDTLEAPVPAGISGKSPLLVADFSGDGLADFYTVDGGPTLWIHQPRLADSPPNLLRRLHDETGIVEFSR